MDRTCPIVEYDFRVEDPYSEARTIYCMYCAFCKVSEIYVIWDKEYPKKEEYYSEAKNMGWEHAASKHWDEYMRAYD